MGKYGSDAFEKAQLFNWNDDKARITELAIRRILNLARNYPNVPFDDEVIEGMIDETMDDLML